LIFPSMVDGTSVMHPETLWNLVNDGLEAVFLLTTDKVLTEE